MSNLNQHTSSPPVYWLINAKSVSYVLGGGVLQHKLTILASNHQQNWQ